MPDKNLPTQLTKAEAEHLQIEANKKLAEVGVTNDILGEQVFAILERQARVLYYPLADDAIWGFFEKVGSSCFVCINTSLSFDKQVFVAAHELYHLWFNHPEDLILASELEETDPEIPRNELKANRFAAEFLVPEPLLKREMENLGILDAPVEIPHVIRLSRLFCVPYRTMVKRLHEIDKVSTETRDDFLSQDEQTIQTWLNRLGLSWLERANPVSLDRLVDLTMEAWEKNLISRAKLEYLLSLAKMTPDDVGVPQDAAFIAPDESELDAIMEEPEA